MSLGFRGNVLIVFSNFGIYTYLWTTDKKKHKIHKRMAQSIYHWKFRIEIKILTAMAHCNHWNRNATSTMTVCDKHGKYCIHNLIQQRFLFWKTIDSNRILRRLKIETNVLQIWNAAIVISTCNEPNRATNIELEDSFFQHSTWREQHTYHGNFMLVFQVLMALNDGRISIYVKK